MSEKTIFSPASFLLPPYGAEDTGWSKWSVIAVDQFTSEIAYWEAAEKIAEGVPSALHLVLPEAYLETEREAVKNAAIKDAMQEMNGGFLKEYADSILYLERTLPDGRIRRGLVGKIDLEKYDYAKGSTPAVRATEATVLERIPPRVAIRSAAPLELPHVMLLLNDTDGLMASVAEKCAAYECLYDFDLMLDGGHAKGYRIAGDALADVLSRIGKYEASRESVFVYAVGDGNHSLAAAKAHYENIKAKEGSAAADHPARYALVELVALEDEALDFEPIYRVVETADPAAFLAALKEITVPGTGVQTVRVLTSDTDETVSFTAPAHALTVGSLQIFIDEYIAAHPGVKCDYIHDEGSLIALAKREGSVGFLFDGMAKEELFPYVLNHGTLPRKTFSMGEARSKRYYMEARRIVK